VATVTSSDKDKVARWHPDMEYDSKTVSESNKNEVDTRKEASDKFKVSERKVRSSEYSKVINPPWRRQSPPR